MTKTIHPLQWLTGTAARITLLLLVSGLLTTYSLHTRGQNNGGEEQSNRWYQIEIFIFANDNPNAAAEEHWREYPELKYPRNTVSLIEPQVEQPAGDTLPSGEKNPVTQDVTSMVEDNAQQEAFVLLGEEQLQLRQIAGRILRQANFRPLFHRAWRQPIPSREQATPVLIRGGDQYDDHYELEGTISLGVERYLHIGTDLWFSTFKSAAGMELDLWPLLPQLPTAAAATNQVTAPEVPLPASDTLPFNLDYPSPFYNLRQKQYVVDQTVTLRQSRRMRSGELHYIDHPLMGVLVKVTPYEAAQQVPN